MLVDDFRVALKRIVGRDGNDEIFLKNRKGEFSTLYSDSENEGITSRREEKIN